MFLFFEVVKERYEVGRILGGRICVMLEKYVDEFLLFGFVCKLEISFVCGGFDVWICMLL